MKAKTVLGAIVAVAILTVVVEAQTPEERLATALAAMSNAQTQELAGIHDTLTLMSDVLLDIRTNTGPAGDPPIGAAGGLVLALPIEIAPERDRAGYRRPDTNRYGRLEGEIHRQLRMDTTPFTCTDFGGNLRETDIEHIVALAEAHDSGLGADEMLLLSSDMMNLTLAMPRENRNVKRDLDASDYLPDRNACWFAGRVVQVKSKWGMTMDPAEYAVLATLLADCAPESVLRPSCGR